MNITAYSRFARSNNHPRITSMIGEWCVHVGVWIVDLMLVYALVGMSS